MKRIALFAMGSAWLAWVSGGSLRRPGGHGFWRFWAWESILGLVLRQAPRWFQRPCSPHQLISWLLLLISPAPLILGIRSLQAAGRAPEQRQDAALLGFERTADLVTTDIYRYIRHPMYSSLLFLTWGAFWKRPGGDAAALAASATACLLATARVEEKENAAFFGDTYRAYEAHTKRFVPFLF